MSGTTEMEPWLWPELHWRGIVNHVRAGRALKPAAWQDGARCAVAFSFDSDHETNELRDGGGSISKLSQGQYGNRQGVPRILDILSRHGVPASFYVPAVTALLYPDEQRRVAAEGHEVGIHGWIHERNSVLSLDAERDLQMRAAEVLEKITGVRPVGIRTPSWDFSANTLAITRDMGLVYDSSHDGRRRLLRAAARRRADWCDRVTGGMDPRRRGLLQHEPLRRAAAASAPSDVFDIFRRELDMAWEEGGVFQLTMHPHHSGYRSRVWVLEELIRHAKARGSVWFATHADIVRFARDNAQ